MVNPHKGDVELIVGSKTYTLRYSHSSLVKLEKQLDKGLMRIMGEMENTQDMRIGTVAALLWAGLQKHHPGMTMDATCDLLDEIEGGSLSVIVGVIGDAFQKAFNAPGTKGTNPPQAGNGTGTSHSLNTPVTVTTPLPSGTSRPES